MIYVKLVAYASLELINLARYELFDRYLFKDKAKSKKKYLAVTNESEMETQFHVYSIETWT